MADDKPRNDLATIVSAEQERFVRIFHPHNLEQFARAQRDGIRFVHYTNAAAARDILRTGEVWMRKSSCMNDYMEVEYGLQQLFGVYRDTDAGKRFRAALNHLFDGVTTDIENLFNSWTLHLRFDTYLTCISEHMGSEDTFGRLSMWRAYGEATGVALVLNNSVFLDPAIRLAAYSSPVAYLDRSGFEAEFLQIARNIEREADFLKSKARQEITERVFNMLRFAALCTKHPGFSEEREWRVIHCPGLEPSPYLARTIELVRGVPQPVCKIPLKNIPEAGFKGDIASLLNRVIIGPTQYPQALAEAFIQLLSDAEVEGAAEKVLVSDIPLRR